MANKFEIKGGAFVITNTGGTIIIDRPQKHVYYDNESLIAGRISMLEKVASNRPYNVIHDSSLSQAVDFKGVAFTEETFREFAQSSLSSNKENPEPSKSQTFTFGDGENHDATVDETSASIATPNNFNWNIIPTSTGIPEGEKATYTVEVSNDNIVFKNYAAAFIDLSHNDGAVDDYLTYNFIRIGEYKAGTVSTGTIKFILTEID